VGVRSCRDSAIWVSRLFLSFFLTNREGAKSAKESVSFFFLLSSCPSRLRGSFVLPSFDAFFLVFFLTNREGAKSAKKEEEEGLR
jgi:hypothetical protein